jgi:hypothetical protein
MYDWFLTGLGWFLSAAGGSSITHLFTRWRDKKVDQTKEKDELTGIGNAICFYLALQQSELINLKKNIEDRKTLLEKQKNNSFDRTIVQITQDFTLCKDLNINIETACKIILSAKQAQRGIPETLQSVFISNKRYMKILETLERYHEAKRTILKDNLDLNTLLNFLEANLSQYEKMIEEALPFAKTTLDSVKTIMLEHFGIKINISMGDTFKSN